jgi:hypothetical protein
VTLILMHAMCAEKIAMAVMRFCHTVYNYHVIYFLKVCPQSEPSHCAAHPTYVLHYMSKHTYTGP